MSEEPPAHLLFAALDRWPGGIESPAPGFGVDAENDVVWLRVSPRPATEIEYLHVASFGDGEIVLHVDATYRLLALGVTHASGVLPAAWTLPPPSNVELRWEAEIDTLELVFVAPTPGIGVEACGAHPPGAPWGVTALVEPSGQLAAVQIFPASAAIEPPTHRPERETP